jgi:glycerophosphoryl diester phosphodiesterase|tara:strand:+ start:4763 stop:5485 length:723 start_codon:yes stop_codon:yes gene_type:complete
MIVKNKIIGHRGASMFAPENSASSLEVAYSQGLEWIETDVQITLDNKLVIFHDEKLERTSNGEGFLALKKLSELKELDIGNWFSEEFTGEKILTFVEFLNLIKKYEFSLQLEIKHMHGKETEIVDEVVNQIQPYLDYFKDKLFVSSFSERCLRLFSKKLPQIPLALALSFVPKNPDLLANEVGVDILHFGDEFVDDHSLGKLKNSKTEFAVATVNDKKRAEFLLNNGVQTILTDNPKILK